MKGTQGKLFHDFLAHYEDGRRQGSAVLCRRGADGTAPGLLYTQLIRDNFVRRRKRQDRDDTILTHMMKGFAVLELVCVNLFLYPWRKEIRTLKKFTGNFVYFVEPVIPEKTVQQILQRVGYSIVRDTEYIIGGTINVEEAKLTAFELYLARLYCDKLLSLMKEKRSESADLLFSELDLEIKNEKENSEARSKHNVEISSSEQTDGINNLNAESKISRQVRRKDSRALSAGLGQRNDSAVDSNYSYSRHLDSEEFLNKYSDLNLAQQPLLPLQNRKINANPQELKDEISKEFLDGPTLAKAGFPASSSIEPDLYEAINTEHNVPDVGGHNALDSKKLLGITKSPTETTTPSKQTQPERLVIKLKMGKMSDEMSDEMNYPIEETLPPDPKEFHFCHKDPKWTCLKLKEAAEDVASSASFATGFSVLGATGECGATDNLHRLCEPPSSMYIPPGGTERQCMRITDLQPDEEHFQAPSLLGDLLQVNETLYKVHEDTKEDFVMITTKPQPNS